MKSTVLASKTTALSDLCTWHRRVSAGGHKGHIFIVYAEDFGAEKSANMGARYSCLAPFSGLVIGNMG